MRLISKTHDYYDGLFSGVSEDKYRVFVRGEPKDEYQYTIYNDTSIEGKEYRTALSALSYGLSYKEWRDKYEYEESIEYGCIGFCGEIYPFIIVNSIRGLNHCCYSIEQLEEYINRPIRSVVQQEAHGNLNIARDAVDGHKRRVVRLEKWIAEGSKTREHIELFFKGECSDHYHFRKTPSVINWTKFYKPVFMERKIPFFLIRFGQYRNEVVFTTNPILKDYAFYKVLDAQSCYQRLEQYLFNELAPPDRVIHEVPDVIKAESHGFNQFSFRSNPKVPAKWKGPKKGLKRKK